MIYSDPSQRLCECLILNDGRIMKKKLLWLTVTWQWISFRILKTYVSFVKMKTIQNFSWFRKSTFFGPASARSYKIGVVGWLVGNAVFSKTALSIFLIFCMKLGDYKGRRVTEPDFWKTIFDLEIFAKRFPN